jgi:DNA-binding NarL/FixJ family response regulator
MPSVRTLVVDDVDDFRNFLCSTLREKTQCEVVGEASSGLQAVQKAEELHPDLIPLHLGLPALNGIEAARRIRKVSPTSKITLRHSEFLSRDRSKGPLRLGAYGYLLKSDTTDLACAVEQFSKERSLSVAVSSKLDFPARTKIANISALDW